MKLLLLSYSKNADGDLHDVIGFDSGSNFVGTWLANKRPPGKQSVASAAAIWLARTAGNYSPTNCIICGLDVDKLLNVLVTKSNEAMVWLPYWVRNNPHMLDLRSAVTTHGGGDFVTGATDLLKAGQPRWVGCKEFNDSYELHKNVTDDFLLSVTCAVRLGLSFNVPETD